MHLTDQADTAVEQSGVKGTHPDIQPEVAVVSAADARRDLAAVRAACRSMTKVVKRLAHA